MGELQNIVLQNSLAGSLFILFILIFRRATRRISKLYTYVLWLVLLLVLLVPPIAGSPYLTARSFVPEFYSAFQETEKEEAVEPAQSPQQDTDPAAAVPGVSQADSMQESQEKESEAINHRQAGTAGEIEAAGWSWLTIVWAVGAGALAAAALYQWIRLRRKVAAAVRVEKGVWRTDEITTPFVMPGIPSRIYLPFALEGRACEDVLAHERKHIRHGDPWIKCLFAAALMIHWFNPLVWLAFCLMGRDMEMFCDECVLRGKSMQEKKRYSQTLLNYACRENQFSPALYFGENSTKSRIRHILYRKRPHVLVSLLCLLLISGCGVSFLTTEKEDSRQEETVPVSEPSAEPEETEAGETEPKTDTPEASGGEEKLWNQKPVVGIGHPGMTNDFAPEELSLLGETEQFALYSMNDGENFLVKAPDGTMIYSEAPAYSNYEIMPLFNELDYDGDGENELAVITCVQHGTGLLIDSLFMTDHTSDSSWKIYQYLDSEYLASLTPYFDTTYDEDGGVHLLFDGNRAGREEYEGGPVGVTEYVDQEYLDNHYAYYAGSQIDFRFVEGTIWLRAELAGYSDIHLAGRFPGHALESTVGYDGEGKWNLASDVRYLDFNLDRCIEEGLLLYFTGHTEEFDQYYTTENFHPEPFDRVCQKMTILIISYPWDNMDAGEVEAYATVRLDDEDSLNYVTLSMQGINHTDEGMEWRIKDFWIEK